MLYADANIHQKINAKANRGKLKPVDVKFMQSRNTDVYLSDVLILNEQDYYHKVSPQFYYRKRYGKPNN